MSTKIYGGFKVVGLDGMFELHREIMAFRKELEGRIRDLHCEWVARKAATLFDEWTLGNRVLSQAAGAYGEAVLELLDRQADVLATGRRDTNINFSCHLSIHPLEGDGENLILGILFTEREEFRQMWMTKPFVEDYHYQNSTDRPEGIPEEEWCRRRDHWHAVLEPFHIPSLVGFTADVGDQAALAYHLARQFGLQAEVSQQGGGLPTIDRVMECVPDFEDRLSRAATDGLWIEKRSELEGLEPRPVSRALAYLKWCASDEGRATLAARKEELRPKLQPMLTRADLFPSRD